MPRLPALIALLAVVAGPAVAQTSLRPGQTATGELTTSDPTLSDGSHYDCFVVPTRRGQRLQIDQTSEAFDSYLTIGLGPCEALVDPESDDDSGGGLNSRLVHLAYGGSLTVRVNSLSAGDTGPYTLTVTELGQQTAEPLSAEATGGPLRQIAQVEGQVVFMVSGDIPPARPTAPIEVWEWQFWPDDTAAFRVRLDCQAGTTQNLLVERYVGGRLEGRSTLTTPAATPPAGTSGAATLQMVCEPGSAVRQRSHADFRSARAQMDRDFAANR